MTAGSDAEEQVVRPALEAALDVAEAGLAEKPPRQPPRGLRSVLGFHKRPSAALGAARRVLDRDDAFRALVLERIDADRLSPGAAAFLLRDDGWRDAVGDAVRALEEAADDDRARADDRAATEQVVTLSARLAELEAEVPRVEAEFTRLREVERQAEEVAERLREQEALNERLTGERQRAVRELADERRRLADRTAQVRSLSADLERIRSQVPMDDGGPDDPTPPARPVDVAEELSALQTRAEAAESASAETAQAMVRLGRELAALGERLDPGAAGRVEQGDSDPRGSTSPEASDGEPGTAPVLAGQHRNGRRGRTVRRRPVRVGRGLRDGSPDATRELLRTPGLVLWVDGYNASMALWGDLDIGGQREALVRALGRLAKACGTHIRVVFDGDSGGAPPVTTPLPVRVVFTKAGVEADDDIIDAVAATDASQPVAVLSADRRVRDGASVYGANLLSPDDLRTVLADGG